MTAVRAERVSAELDGDFVVFLGAREQNLEGPQMVSGLSRDATHAGRA